MATVKLRYIGALLYADVPILGREGDEPLEEHGAGCIVRGEVFECDKEIAGRAPTYDEDGNVADHGEGLLAQPSNFELAGPPTSKKRRPRKKAAAVKATTPSTPEPVAAAAVNHETAEA